MSEGKKNISFEDRERFEHFLDDIENTVDRDDAQAYQQSSQKIMSDAASKRTLIGLLCSKPFVLAAVLMLLPMWYFWPYIGDNNGSMIVQNDLLTESFLKQGDAIHQDKHSLKDSDITQQKMEPVKLDEKSKAQATVATLGEKEPQIFRVSVHLANIRSAPTSDAKIVARLKQGTAVIVIKRERDWYQVRLHNGNLVWVYHTLLK